MPPPRRATRTFAAFAVSGLTLLGCAGDEPRRFIHVEGGRVLDENGQPVWLRAMALGRWTYCPQASTDCDNARLSLEGHQESDYEELARHGIESVRLLFNPEASEQELLYWIELNVGWARKHGLRLVLDAMIPPEAQAAAEDPSQGCSSAALWSDDDRDRGLKDRWRAIAGKFFDEPVIAGYGLLHTPNINDPEQWQNLANDLAGAIRSSDTRHMLLVGSTVRKSGGVDDRSGANTLRKIDDPNVLYEFDHMQPWAYVAQTAETPAERYPQDDTTTHTSLNGGTWLHASWDSRPGRDALVLPPGDSGEDWIEREFFYTVTDPDFKIAVPVLQSDLNAGTAYFADITVEEYSDPNTLTRSWAIKPDPKDDWFLWEGDAAGQAVPHNEATHFDVADYRERRAIKFWNTTSLANLSNSNAAFRVEHGRTYKVRGWIGGERTSTNAQVMIRLDFWRPMPLKKAELAVLFDDFVTWGGINNVPLSVSEFGASVLAFERGADEWATHTIELMVERNLHFSYYTYRDPVWGLTNNPAAFDAITKKVAEY